MRRIIGRIRAEATIDTFLAGPEPEAGQYWLVRLGQRMQL